ncbi:E3 ubiquitin-protein ligase upl4 [Trifolium repens]|nr:E3 ubiquitin-protein ligase upl4 [Trifolium repens]
MGSKFDIEKFTSSNDFGLWKVKMRAVLVQNKCVEALKGETQVEWFCKLQGGVHRGSTEFETLVEEFHLKVEDFQLEVEASDSETR